MHWRAMVCALALVGCRRTHEAPTVETIAPEPAPAIPDPIGAPSWVPPLPPPRPPATPSTDGGSVNGDPRGPRPEELNRVMASAQPALQACLDGAGIAAGVDVTAQVSCRILPDGHAADVVVNAATPPASLDCMRRVVEALPFPRFEGAPVAGSFPFAYRRSAKP